MNSSKGFTLIELVIVIVIVILGILSAAALPKFISLSKDAKVAVLTQFSVSVKAANNLIFLKSKMPSYSTFPVTGRADLIDIDIDRNGVIDLNGVDLRLLHSYIDNHEIYKQIDVSEEFKLSGGKVFEEQGANLVFIGYDTNNNKVSDDNCYFRYTQAQSATVGPAYDIIADGC
ncbi:prepilin-type N-terminal cleavage/methylation domain-containing protein [Colwellia hornerae]|uniref:Pilus assembly protein PilD n=1 Tax=Colwellia hornerae TaxID=89402 RepID=A0A5C6Q8X7_9GAMM|nr:prepilin-type N-terminal cleavage/methylation domain-containing protein [Colwellia hornerae]TWX50597.1 pilus assembly protein PilD [Colwellia hornerae]TWX56153.1 pilus assembly protein PilD [Colwellia hornerae]TWX64997.1 pilus assembly protein PilD [Colwellia hornerae]